MGDDKTAADKAAADKAAADRDAANEKQPIDPIKPFPWGSGKK